MKKSLLIILAAILLGGGILVGYYLIPQEECPSANINEADNQSACTLDVDLEAQLSISEREQMYAAAREYIKKYSVEGMVTNLEIIKLLDKWALLRMMPINIETDVAAAVMEKVDGEWVARIFGTALPEWQERVPELFE